MRFTRVLQGHPIYILLDGASDERFIQPRLAKILLSDIVPARSFNVLMGNGQTLQVEGLIENLQVKVQNQVINFPT